jgi:alpha/beta superfamily hydrolase
MNIHTEIYLIDGPVGKIEVALDLPDEARAASDDAGHPAVSLKGVVLVAHPHPLFGGTMDNKVAQTLARTFVQLGYAAFRSNFRGVGKTEGVHDNGIGERDDLMAVIAHLRGLPGFAELPLVLAGFSFGTFVVSHVAQRLVMLGVAPQRLVLVGTAASRWEVAQVPADTIVIHGEQDDTVPLSAVMDWARPQELPVTVIPGAEHFFHRKLHVLKGIIIEAWRV